MVRVGTANGPVDTMTYLVSLFLPNRVFFSPVRAARGVVSGADVLVGMDVIGAGDFAVTNAGGKTVFSFSVPPTRHIDFVAESRARTPIVRAGPKIGRNQLCPCGSGKKYKNCCGKNVV